MRGLPCLALLIAAFPLLATALDWDSTAHEILIPTAAPELEEPDPWFCAASNLTEFFNVPLPYDDLYEAIQNRGAEYFKECTATVTVPNARAFCNPSKDEWCQITTAVPPSALDDYLEYGSSAFSWWQEHSSAALELAPLCPDNWYNAMFKYPASESWLNRTIIFAACYEEALQATATPVANEPSPATASGLGASTAVPRSSGANQGVTATPGPEPESGVVRRETGTGIWAVMAVAAAAIVHGGF